MIGQPEDPIETGQVGGSGPGFKGVQQEVDREAELAALIRLNEATSRLMAIQNLPDGLWEVLTTTIELMGSDFGNVYIFDDQRHVLTIAAQQGFRQDFLDTFREVPTEDDSAFGRALRTGEPLVIEDVESDPTYAPFRVIARSACYRGVVSMPLIGTGGTTLGMISTHFRQPHRPSDVTLRHLRWFARRAASFIWRCQIEEKLRASEERLRLATSGVDLGIWQWDLSTQKVEWSDQCKRHLGFPLEKAPSIERFLSLLHPEDRDRIAALLQQSADNRSDHFAEYRVIWPDDTIHWIYAGGRVYSTGNGDSLIMVGVSQDITPRKQAEKELERMRLLLEEGEKIANLGAWEYIAATEETVWSPGELRIYGLSPDDPSPDYPTWLRNFIHPEDAEILHRTFTDAFRRAAAYELYNRIVRPNGSVRFVHDLAYPFFSKDGTLVKYVGMTMDITDRKHSEESLQKSEKRFQLAMEAAQEGIWDWEVQTGRCYFSPGYFDMLGFKPENHRSHVDTWVNFLRPSERDRILTSAKSRLTQDGRFELEFELRHKSGRYIWISSRGQVVERDPQGNALRAIGTHFDITERKLSEQRLIESERRFRSLFEHLPIAYQSLDIEGRWLDANQKLAELFGYTNPEDMLGKNIIDHWDESIRDQFASNYDRFKRDLDLDGVLPMHRLDGTPVVVQIAGRVQRDLEGRFLRTHCILIDVTEREALQQKMESLNIELEQQVVERTAELKAALKAKGQFVANMSHEIRNPLNTINILASLLARDSLTSEQTQFVSKIQANVRSLSGVIDDILDFSKMESGQFVLDTAPFRLAELIDHLKSGHEEAGKSKGLAMHWPETPWPGELIGDLKRIQQVLDNIIGNAVKFTERGDVWCRLSLESQSPDDSTFKFEVMDSGIGIQPEVIPKLLEPFTQADSSITRRFGGTGLGLSICKHLVGLMGGQINITSTLGMGSVFAFCLTLPKAMKEQQSNAMATQPPRKRLEGLCILAVDDDEVSLSLIKIILEKEGAIVHTAKNGESAFDWLRNHPKKCHVVLMDIQMPIMDGITATLLIRNVLGLKDLPILAVTAGILPDQQQAALDAGMTEMLRKPVDIENLVERLIRICK